MTALSIILGILLAVCGVLCLCTPVGTAFGLMYFFIVLLFVFGIMSLVRNIANRTFGIDFVFSIITIVLGCFIVFSPNASFFTELAMIYTMAAWLIVRGIVGIVIAAKAKKFTGGGVFAAALIVSIFVIIAGIYSFFHPVYFSAFIGILAGVYFIVEGIDMIVFAVVNRKKA